MHLSCTPPQAVVEEELELQAPASLCESSTKGATCTVHSPRGSPPWSSARSSAQSPIRSPKDILTGSTNILGSLTIVSMNVSMNGSTIAYAIVRTNLSTIVSTNVCTNVRTNAYTKLYAQLFTRPSKTSLNISSI